MGVGGAQNVPMSFVVETDVVNIDGTPDEHILSVAR
jgi:hypothetical protein